MKTFSTGDLFALKALLEQQLERDFIHGPSASDDGSFDFLIGEWHSIRTSFNETGNVAHIAKGSVAATYVFDGRAIQEDFYHHREDDVSFRAGSALYTYRASSKEWFVAAMDASTGTTSYQPTWIENEVHYTSVVELPDRNIHTKSRIYNISPERTEWEQRVSIDGVHWFKNYHIVNNRKR